MKTNEKVLNWIIGCYAVIDILFNSELKILSEPFRIIYVWFPCLLVSWTLILACKKIINSKVSYHGVEGGDYYRLFFVLWSGYTPFAYDSLGGFYSFMTLATLLFLAFSIMSLFEFYHNRELSSQLVGWLFFMYCLFGWGKNSYVYHFGEHIIGHYLEMPSYKTQYYVRIAKDGTNNSIKAVADISVGSRFVEFNTGEDYYGNERWVTEEYREAWVDKIHFPNGTIISIKDQWEPLELKGTTYITDTRGSDWHVRLLDEPVN